MQIAAGRANNRQQVEHRDSRLNETRFLRGRLPSRRRNVQSWPWRKVRGKEGAAWGQDSTCQEPLQRPINQLARIEWECCEVARDASEVQNNCLREDLLTLSWILCVIGVIGVLNQENKVNENGYEEVLWQLFGSWRTQEAGRLPGHQSWSEMQTGELSWKR